MKTCWPVVWRSPTGPLGSSLLHEPVALPMSADYVFASRWTKIVSLNFIFLDWCLAPSITDTFIYAKLTAFRKVLQHKRIFTINSVSIECDFALKHFQYETMRDVCLIIFRNASLPHVFRCLLHQQDACVCRYLILILYFSGIWIGQFIYNCD